MKNHQSVQSLVDSLDFEVCREWLLELIRPFQQPTIALGSEWPPPRPHKASLLVGNVPEWVETAEVTLALIDRVDMFPESTTNDPELDTLYAVLGDVDMTDGMLRTRRDRLKWAILRLSLAIREERQQLADVDLGRTLDQELRVQRPKKMREAKAKSNEIKRRENRQRAEKAMTWARRAFPTAAEDNKISFLKQKAAEHLHISARQLSRWLGGR